MTTAELARFMFDRQAATYEADPTLTELAWCDPDIVGFWTTEAAAILAYIGQRWGDLAG